MSTLLTLCRFLLVFSFVQRVMADDKILQTTLTISKRFSGDISSAVETKVHQQLGPTFSPIRFFISDVIEDNLIIEAVVTNIPVKNHLVPNATFRRNAKPEIVVSLIPTGIQAAFGGWAGDATPVTKLLAKSAPVLITNPNSVNASNFIDIPENVIYAEGSQIDFFMQGKIKLNADKPARIGVIIEATSPENLRLVQNLINTSKMLGGVDIVGSIVTSEPIGSRVEQTPSGAYVGTIDRPDILIKAGQALKEKGATAIAVTTLIGGYDEQLYLKHFSGNHPNPIGGVETIISHLLVAELGIPAAHGPLVNYKPPGQNLAYTDPRGAGEFVSQCGLYCVLRGLSQAPQMEPMDASGFSAEDVVAVIAPADAMGGIPVLEANRKGIPVIGVRTNETILDVTAEKLGLDSAVIVDSYIEAAGAVVLRNKGATIAALKKLAASPNGLKSLSAIGEDIRVKARVSVESVSRPLWTCPAMFD